MAENGAALHVRIRADLLNATKRRDRTTANALRGLLHAIDNESAVPLESEADAGVSEVPRRAITQPMVIAAIEREAAERREAIAHYEEIGQPHAAELVRAELNIFLNYL